MNTHQRANDRPHDQLRPLFFTLDYTMHAEGSVLVAMGNTKVLCTASIEQGVPRWLKGKHQGWLTAEYAMLPRATHTRGAREAVRGGQSGRTQEIQRLIGRAMRQMVDLKALGERTIYLDCDVLQADGGTRCASICGAAVALNLALKRQNLPMRGLIAAVSLAKVGDEILLDVDYAEDSACDVDLNLVMNEAGGIIEIQATAEGASLASDELLRALAIGKTAIAQIITAQKQVLGA